MNIINLIFEKIYIKNKIYKMQPNKPESNNHRQKDSLTYVNDFITKLNKKILSIPKNSQQTVCKVLSAILDKNKNLMRQYSYEGLPDELPILRAFLWKILLNYLPEEHKKWEETLLKQRSQYNNYKKFIEGRLQLELKEKKYKSKDTLEQIIKDVYRTNTQISFFHEPVNKDKKDKKEEYLKLFEKRKNCTFTDIKDIYYNEGEDEIHVDVMKRILFIYTYICQDISYHQGMNELLAPIYYCFSYDQTYQEETEENIEADSFWCFYNLMSKVSLSFVSAREKGLDAKSYIFENCLKFIDEEIYDKLIQLNIRSEYYCYKWFILLFSQEFELNKLLKIWDLIFSHDDIYYYVTYIGLAIMIMKKDIIIKGEMVDVMQTLQNFEDININELLNKTKELNEKFKSQLDEFILKTKQIHKEKNSK